MRKGFIAWGILTIAAVCRIASIEPSEEISEPLEWEKIPIIVKTVEIDQKSNITFVTYGYDSNYVCPNTPRGYTQKEAQMLMKLAQAEAGNQSKQGMMLVMEVVLNRVASPDFPNSIEEVIMQSGQFETVSNGAYEKAEPSAESHLALAEIEKGVEYDTSIIGFETSVNGRVLEKYYNYAYTVGAHDFYTSKKD